jgi:hypothetical protein
MVLSFVSLLTATVLRPEAPAARMMILLNSTFGAASTKHLAVILHGMNAFS